MEESDGEEKENSVEGGEGKGGGDGGGGDDTLLSVLLHRLLAVLKQLVVLGLKRSESHAVLASYKSMYTVALRAAQTAQSHSCSDCGQLEQTRTCLKTIASLQRH